MMAMEADLGAAMVAEKRDEIEVQSEEALAFVNDKLYK
jgi:hypothetical protein